MTEPFNRMKPKIPIAGPWVTDLEVRYTADAAANAWYDRAGEWPARFEKEGAIRVREYDDIRRELVN